MGSLYRRFPALLMARRNLARTKVRTLLAALGIVIGVIAIASLGMFGASLKYSIQQDLGGLGNQVIVSPGEDAEGPYGLSKRQVAEIERAAPSGAQVLPIKQRGYRISLGREEPEVRFTDGMANPGAVYEAQDGRIPDPLRSGALVGWELAEEHDLEAGSTITVNGSSVRVKAILAPSGGVGFIDPGNKIILPQSYYDRQEYDRVVVMTESGHQANATARAVRASLNQREQRVQVRDMSNLVGNIDSAFQTLNAFLVGIGSISLLVAGVSILNVMLMSTVERREEIGVLRAVGYQRWDVLRIMLAEAALLGVIGGVVGVVLSVIAGVAINFYVVNDPTAVLRVQNGLYIGLAFGFGLLTAVVSGLYPAWKAATERPVEALRS